MMAGCSQNPKSKTLEVINLRIAAFIIIFVLSIGLAYADAEDFTEAKKLIDAKTPCSQLTESQLEIMGDYTMEQIHPGEAHEVMDKMMGGEGSESLRLMHIAMAKRLYCNDISDMTNYGMMGYGMMGTGLKRGISYGGMMNMAMYNMMGYGMMGNLGYGYWSFLNFFTTLLVVGLVILVYLWVIKLWREVFGKRK
ncbi:hypothetical protein HYX02_02730 [Candidatus Woesearchaeota archaeon]|nr:hypothetical protein [Candidatus Woesearchaeota archaeon]